MYPIVRLLKNPEDPRKPLVKRTFSYLELLTIFPDDSPESQKFGEFLNTKPYRFEQLWGEQAQ
jgi:CRISPR-associated protein Cmr6